MRNTFDGDGARYLIECAARNGNGAMGIEGPGYFETGVALDAVVYDSHSPLVAATSDRNILSTLVYAGDAAMTLGTLVDGRWCVKNLLHKDMVEIRGKFVRGMRGVNR